MKRIRAIADFDESLRERASLLAGSARLDGWRPPAIVHAGSEGTSLFEPLDEHRSRPLASAPRLADVLQD
jgi:hypothetical protein